VTTGSTRLRARAIVIARRVLRAAAQLGPRELHFYVGLCLAGAGGAFVSPRWTLISIGAALSAVGYWGTR
jgi:hypothetical protein